MVSVIPVRPTPGFQLASELRRRRADLTTLTSVASTGVPRPVDRWRVDLRGRACLVEQGVGAEGRRRLVVEAAGRAWARRIGVPSPPVIAHDFDTGWLISELGEPIQVDREVVDWAMSMADRIAEATYGPTTDGHESDWSTVDVSSVERARRAVRMARHGLTPGAFLRARREYQALADHTWAHGDFYVRNLVSVEGEFAVVDWEFAGSHPRFTDHVRFWSLLPGALRPYAMDQMMADRTPRELRQLGVVIGWLGIRILAENLSVPAESQNAADLEHAHALQGEARFWSSSLGAIR